MVIDFTIHIPRECNFRKSVELLKIKLHSRTQRIFVRITSEN